MSVGDQTLRREFRKLAKNISDTATRTVFTEVYKSVLSGVLQKSARNPKFSSPCWIWPKKQLQIKVKGKHLSLRHVMYSLAFPKAKFDQLKTACGEAMCINPEHLVDKVAAFWEDMEFLLDNMFHPAYIRGRLGVSADLIWQQGKRAIAKGDQQRSAIYRRYLDALDVAADFEDALFSRSEAARRKAARVAAGRKRERRKINPEVWSLALRLANKDPHRIEIRSDTEVVVH